MSHLHERLMQRNGWYAQWHNLPGIVAVHWGIFVLAGLLSYAIIAQQA